MKQPRAILITGASSGLGAALALAYAGPGVTLALGGRNRERLEAVAARCRERGAGVETRVADVTDEAAMAAWILAADAAAPLDLVIANAGVSGGGVGEVADRRMFAVNLAGVLNTVLPAIPAMQSRGRGQIAIMSSLAGFRGFPDAPAYSATKAAVKSWGEGLRGSLRGDGIGVSVICPGFIRTPMTEPNPFPMPFLMDAGRAAAIVKRRLARNHARIAFPWPMYAMAWLIGALPPLLSDRLVRGLGEKPPLPEEDQVEGS
jgi:short-subunit dehydrogenase